jgi:TolB-like protein
VAFGGWRLLQGKGGAAAGSDTADPNHIAVLYFKTRGGGDSLSFVADGLTEALIHSLSLVKPLQVISANGVRPFRSADVPPDSIASALKVGTLVDGTLAEAGGRLRLQVSLINATTGSEIGTKTLEQPRSEIFALQDQLAQEVAIFLRQQLGSEVQLKEQRAGTRNTAAWELMQHAQEEAKEADALAAAGDSTGATSKFARADSMLARTETLDPKWAAPPTLRGWLNYRQSRMAPLADPAYHTERIERGLVLAERALKLKPNDPDALEVRGTLRYWKWLSNLVQPNEGAQLYVDAESDLRGSVQANPAQASAWTTLSHLLINKPALGEAKLAARRAYDADPYLSNANVTLWRLFTTSYDLEDAVEAKRWCDVGLERFPKDYRFAECQLWLPELKAIKPDIPAAWKALDAYVELSPPSMRPFNRLLGQMRVAIALARAGLADSARSVARRSEGDPNIDSNRNLAELAVHVYLILGDKDAALNQLSIFLAANPQQRELYAKDESWQFRDLRSDPRYVALMGGK